MFNSANYYAKNNAVQEYEATKLLSKYSFKWNSEEKILDAGCGTGNITKKLLSNLSSNITVVVGSDIDPSMISYAQKFNDGPKLSYQVVNLMEKDTFPTEWEAYFNKIFSFATFHWLPDHKRVLGNLRNCLKPKGEIFLYFLQEFPGWNRAFNKTSKGRWEPYLANFKTTLIYVDNIGELQNNDWITRSDPLKAYLNIVEESGFEVIHAETVLSDRKIGRMELINSTAAMLPQLRLIPEAQQADFLTDFFDAWNPSFDENDMVDSKCEFKRILVHAVKK